MTHTSAFELLREQDIPSLKLRYQEYRHRVTGAQHIHLAADHKENVFLVALRTVPHDSTGVAIFWNTPPSAAAPSILCATRSL